MYSTALDTKKNAIPDHHQTRPSPKTPASGIPSPYVISGMQVPGQAPGNWNTRLSHCCDDPANCAITCFCPCITFGQIAEIVNKGSTSCCENAVIYGLFSLFGLACLYSCMYRSKMRIQYDLEEEPCSDCLVHFCCETCALCQEHRELNKRGFDMGIGWEANVDRQRRGRVTGVTTTAPIVSSPMTR